MEKVKVGVIGCGCIANAAHIPSYMKCDDVEIKYFCDIVKSKAEKAVEEYKCGSAIDDYHIILNDPEIDAVSVCTPNLMHKTIAIDALRAGKHVLCEKPAARIYSEALEMQKVQHETGKILNIGVVNRFATSVNEVRRRIMSGELGEVYHVFVNFRCHRSIPGIGGAFTTKAISGGGVLIDWGVHRIDLVMYCLGDPQPLAVCGKAFSKLGCDIPNYLYRGMWSEETRNVNGTYDVDDSVTAFIRTEGPIISLEGAWAQNIEPEENYIDFIGTEGGIRLVYGGGFSEYKVASKTFISEEAKFDRGDMFLNEIQSFIHSVKTGEKIQSHIDCAILTSKIMQGIYDSSDSGKEIVF